MNIKRFIDQNRKQILRIIIIVVFVLFVIKSLNLYYEEDEKRKKIEANEIATNNQKREEQYSTPNDYGTESDSIEKTMSSFVNYCNKREIENAYKMLTDECKEAMFPTVEEFERIYINNVYENEKEYELKKWATDGNKYTYYVDLYENLLATGNVDSHLQEYYTFIKSDDGTYKMNINNYIYGEDRNIEVTQGDITVKIEHVDIYEEYEEISIVIANNSDKAICLTGNKYAKNIYLQNLKKTIYSSFNSKFDSEKIVMNPNSYQNFRVKFNKSYDTGNKAVYLVLSDIILDYEEYLKYEDKTNYENRTSIKIEYQ